MTFSSIHTRALPAQKEALWNLAAMWITLIVDFAKMDPLPETILPVALPRNEMKRG
jgi:hypothetical protein